MPVRRSLLTILTEGPCYGAQLRAEHQRRTGSARPLNVGQIYTTLARLERDGLVEVDGEDEQGRVRYAVTEEGRAQARAWLRSPGTPPDAARDEAVVRVLLAATLPGGEAEAVVATQRAEAEEAAAAARDRLARAGAAADGEALVRALADEAELARAEAQLAWLAAVGRRLAQSPASRRELPLRTEHPRRGRPPRPDAPAGSGTAPGP